MPNKKDLILIHGALGSKLQFENIRLHLDSEYSIHTFDLPAHGLLSWQKDQFSMYNFVNFVRNYIIKNELNKPLVFGFSMGGYIALTLQSQCDIFSKIMTLNTKFDWDINNALKQSKMFNPQTIMEKVPEYAEYLISLHSKENWEFLLDKHKNLILNIPNENPLSNYALGKINIPILLTKGENDNMVTESETKEVMKNIQKSEYFQFDNVGHPIEKIDSLILTNKIKEFLI